MAGNRRYENSKNPFFADEDNYVDDDTFLTHSKSGSSGYMFGSSSNNDYLSAEQKDLEERRMQLLERKRAIEERTIESSNRSIGLLRDSEQIGVATAEELLRQREQLERTEQRLDEINNTLRFSQKHITSIKSVFGSLKNYISGRSGAGEPSATPSVAKPAPITRETNALAAKIDDIGPVAAGEHPALKLRGLSEETYNPRPVQSSAFQDANKILDNNLEEMCSSLVRLRGLAEGLGGEIETQNDLLDRMDTKTEKADLTVSRQNRDMARLLKK